MKKLLLPLVFLANTLPAGACINGETRELKDGTLLFADRVNEAQVPRGHDFRRIDYAAVMARLEAGWRRTGNADYRSDMGVLLLLQQKYSEARDLYLAIERSRPGRYSTASNLGTVYELMGKNDSALHWIRRAVAINPRAHQGSEWIHVRLLEAKVAGIADPSTQALLDTDFGRGPRPQTTLSVDRLWALEKGLFYQLNERMSFLAPPDPVIGRLLFELGNLRWVGHQQYSVEELYAAARRYGYSDTLLDQRLLALRADILRAGGDSSGAAALEAAARDTLRAAASNATATRLRKRRPVLPWAIGGGIALLAFVGLLYFRRGN